MKVVKLKNVTRRLVAAVLSVMMVLSGLAHTELVRAEETEGAVAETESTATDTSNTYSYEGDGYAVTYTITNSWNDGYTAEVSIKNTGDKKIHNWNLMFSLDGEITNIWNAKISSKNDEGIYTVEGEEYNPNISPDETVSFGFNAASSKAEIPELHFSQSVQMPVKETDFEVDYAVSDDWETGFVGEIGILNKSSKSFKDWCIAFDWDNEIDNIWNAKIISHEEKHYVISCETYNRSIEAGQRIQFGFSCQSGKSSNQPENITVTHYTDGNSEDEENNDDSDVEDEIDPSEVTEYAEIEYQDGNCAMSVIDDVRFVNNAPELLEMEWVSSDESVVSNEGHVTRGQENQKVTITAKIQYKGQDYQKDFELTVIRKTNIDVNTLQDYSLSQLDEMNSGDEDYEADVNDYRYLESVYGKYSDVKVDSYETALVSLYNIKSAMGISNPFEELKVTDVYADEYSYIFKFDQIYKGVQVLNCGVTVSADKNGIADYFASSYFPVYNDFSVVPKASLEEAVQSAALCGYTQMDEKMPRDQLVVFNEYGNGMLVWNLYCIKEDNPWGMYEVFVDAQTGEALFAYEVFSGIEGNGKDLGGVKRKFEVEKQGNKYRLVDSSRKISVYKGTFKYPITKTNNNWTKTEVSAMANTKDVYDYFKNVFKRKSIDNKGGEINIYLNADFGENARWTLNGINIGNGTGDKFDKKSLAAGKDVIAHEFTHGVAFLHTHLGDKGTMGTISEAFADIFACYVDGNWEIGEDVVDKKKRKCLRNIKNPKDSQCPTKYGGQYYDKETDEKNTRDSIHENSTVISHIAYRMESLKLSEDSKQIWYKALTLQKNQWTDFWKVRKNVVAAANDKCSKSQLKEIKLLFDQAGITEEKCKKSSTYFKELDESARINLKKGSADKKIQMTGKVVKADKDFDFSNNTALESVLVKNASGKELTKTDQRGSYLAYIKEDNPMELHFSKSGYLDETMYIPNEYPIGQDMRYCELAELIPEEDKGKGKADGYICDSVTGDGIKGLKICIRKGINNIYTHPEATIETGQNGYYQTPELDAGNYCLEISSEDGKYMSSYFNIKVFGNMSMKNQNMSISASLKENQIRVVLTWGTSPKDLDSHLDYSLSNGKFGHISYMEKESVLNNVCIAKLDVDDVDGYGPETTTIYNDETGDYTFYVEDYIKSTGLGDGNAMVRVYLGNQSVPSFTFTVPEGKGNIWTVFKYNSAVGRLMVVNELGDIVKE